MPPPASHTPLMTLHSYRACARLEARYAQTLRGLSKSLESALQVHHNLDVIERALNAHVKRLLAGAGGSSALSAVLTAYLETIHTAHQNATCRLGEYIALVWPDDASTSKPLTRLLKRHPVPPRKNGMSRAAHHAQLDQTFDAAVRAFNETHRSMEQCWRKTLLTSAGTANVSWETASDWISGYAPDNQHLADYEVRCHRALFPSLKHCQRNALLATGLRWMGQVLVCAGIAALLHFGALKLNFYAWANNQILSMRGLDAASLNQKQKKQYFYERILDLNVAEGEQEINEALERFLLQRLHKRPYAPHIFVRHVLQPLMPLLSKEGLTPTVKMRVIAAAGLLGSDVQSPLLSILNMFEGSTIQERALRNSLLELRRAMVARGIFLFNFITLKGGVPYVFLYGERILDIVPMSADKLNLLGLNTGHYAKFVQFPLKVFIVSGKQYPFKDRAGYFEGEFGIVFKDISANWQWTAWHELAHVVDNMRYKYGNNPLPRNIEVNALLFPLIFMPDPKDYLFKRLLPIARTIDGGDTYVQGAKGILNGFRAFMAPPKPPPLTDDFSLAALQQYEERLSASSKEALNKEAILIFRSPGKYLSSARGGEYRGVVSNAEEVIAGTPHAPPQGFVLRGFGGRGPGDSRIKFQFDDSGDEDFFSGKDVWTITKQFVMLLFNRLPSANTGFHLANVIAAILNFILIELAILWVHVQATPYRKRKFYGATAARLIEDVYKEHPVSNGRSTGGIPGERQLLTEALSSGGQIDESLKDHIRQFKNTASSARQAVFDTLLTLAPYPPEASRIRSKWHDLLFWLPFAGPAIGRSDLVFPRQQAFCRWEEFNRQLLRLAKQIIPQTTQEQHRRGYAAILQQFKRLAPASAHEADTTTTAILREISARTQEELRHSNSIAPRAPLQGRPAYRLGSSEGEFDHLAAYQWNDDVKRIDWRATARSVESKAMVRKYRGSAQTHCDILVDFRGMSHRAAQSKISADFAHALQHVKKDQDIRTLILIMPGGEIKQITVPVKGNQNTMRVFAAIWDRITHTFAAYQEELQAISAHDLDFYTEDENKRYRASAALTDFDHASGEPLPLAPIPAKSITVYLVGVARHERAGVLAMLPRDRQPYYWP